MSERARFAVIGAGAGGHALAGHLGLRGFDVAIYDRNQERIDALAAARSITLDGEIVGEGPISLASCNIAEVIRGRQIIMVATTANAHGPMAQAMAPHLTDDQIVVLNPGRSFGALEVRQAIREHNPANASTICEASTLVFTTRVHAPGRVRIHGIKKSVALAAVRYSRTRSVVELLQQAFPQMRSASSVIETSLGNIGSVFHPTITVLNEERVRNRERFLFYCEGVTPEIADYMIALDEERRAIAKKFGIDTLSILEWLVERYDLAGKSLMELLRSNRSYQDIVAPTTFQHRYLLEDVPTGLVPLASFGKRLGVPTPHIDHMIARAEALTGRDFLQEGRTLERMGLADGIECFAPPAIIDLVPALRMEGGKP